MGLALLLIAVPRSAAAPTYTVLHAFSGPGGNDGGGLWGSLVLDARGNVYGTTSSNVSVRATHLTERSSCSSGRAEEWTSMRNVIVLPGRKCTLQSLASSPTPRDWDGRCCWTR